MATKMTNSINHPTSPPANKPARLKPKSQNNSFSKSHTIGTSNINIKTIMKAFIKFAIIYFTLSYIMSYLISWCKDTTFFSIIQIFDVNKS